MQNTDKKNSELLSETVTSLNSQLFVDQIFNILHAQGPHPMLVDGLKLFGQFIGIWDMDVSFYDEDGKEMYHQKGEWAFFWILDGRVIQDVLVYPNPDMNMSIAIRERRTGTSLRYFNSKNGTWKIIWLGAVTGNIVFLTGKTSGKEIILEEVNSTDGDISKWIFTDINPNQFHWKGFNSKDNGNTWTLDQEMFGYRRETSLSHDNKKS